MTHNPLESYIIEHCSPTLAGLKIASLFSYPYAEVATLFTQVSSCNLALSAKGVFIRPLRMAGGKALLYVYRKSGLESRLRQPDVSAFLARHGYPGHRVSSCIGLLHHKLSACEAFPHEIGIFLGYPLADVEGFIKHGGKNCICSGCWKVYGNARAAKRAFQKYKKCRHIYRKVYRQGRSITQMTVTDFHRAG